MKISFIGFGKLAKAIAHGLLRHKTTSSNLSDFTLFASAPSLTSGVNQYTIHTHYDNREIAQDADVVILAVKPALMHQVVHEIQDCLANNPLVISVAAGVTLEWFSKNGLTKHALIRTMPNIAATIGDSVTPMIANKKVTNKQKELAEQILGAIGITHWVNDESLMDSFTALTGSGPAYLFLFVEALIEAAVQLGIDEPVAKNCAIQTCYGALKLIQQIPMPIHELREQVTSPNGTTQAALSLLNPALKELILNAMQAARARSFELGRL